MKFLSAPRQPFVGLSLMAAIGIIIADLFPLSSAALTVLTIILAICIVIAGWRPILLATYTIVGIGFFLLHNLETSNTEGWQLADELGGRPRVVTAKAQGNRIRRSEPIHARRLAGSLERHSGIW